MASATTVRDRQVSIGRVLERGLTAMRDQPAVIPVVVLLFYALPDAALSAAFSHFVLLGDRVDFSVELSSMLLLLAAAGAYGAPTKAIVTRAVVSRAEGLSAGSKEAIRAGLAVAGPDFWSPLPVCWACSCSSCRACF